jgi:hypothetical protein
MQVQLLFLQRSLVATLPAHGVTPLLRKVVLLGADDIWMREIAVAGGNGPPDKAKLVALWMTVDGVNRSDRLAYAVCLDGRNTWSDKDAQGN